MQKMKFLSMLLIALGFGLLGTSCTQSDTDAATTLTLSATATDEAQAAGISDDITNEVDNYVTTAAFTNTAAGVKSMFVDTEATGPTITVDKKDSVNFPKTIIIDYGTTGITGKRNNTLKGKIIVVVSNKMWIANSNRTITFENFSVNDNAITGKKILTFKGLNADKNPYWTISVNDTTTRTDGTKVIWNSERTRVKLNGNGTPYIYWDDNYSITGSSNGINARGKAYTIVIDDANPLLIGGGYRYFTKGTLTITSESKTAVIDYGDGTKDNKATVTVNGVSKEINLK